MPRNVARGSILGIAGQGWQLFTALFLYAFLARKFGVAVFGSWTVVLSVLAWFEIFVTAGVVKVTTKAISESPPEKRKLAVAAYTAQVTAALVAFVALVLLAPLLARMLGNPALTPLLRISALDIPLFGLLLVASSIVLGVERFERQALAWIVYATAKAGLIALLVASGFWVTGALVGNALSSLVGFSAMFIPTRGERPSRAETIGLARWMFVAAVPFLSLALIEGLGQSVDLWIVSAMVASKVLIGFYASATILAEIPVFLFLGLNRVIFPSVARARSDGEHELAAHYTKQAVRLAIIVTVMGVAFIAAMGRQVIVLLYGATFVGAYVPVVLLMAAGMGRTIRATCTEVLMAESRRREALTLLVVTVLLELILVVVVTPRFGIDGAAAATAFSALIAAVWGGFVLRASVGARPLATLVRCVVSGGVVAAGLAVAMPAPDTSTGILLAATVGLLALGAVLYVGGLWLLGEFGADDIESVRIALGRRG